MKHALLLMTALLFSQLIFAQSQSIQGKIYDEKTEEGLPFANVVLLQNGIQVSGTTTDLDGNYSFTDLKPGIYDVEAIYVGYLNHKIEGIQISQSQIVPLDLEMGYPKITCCYIGYSSYIIPLIDHDDTSTSNTMDSGEISRMPF